MKTGVSQLEPDLKRMHLQWFAEDAATGGESESDESDETNGSDDEVAELKKTLKNLQKDLSGKDRKITELLEKNKTIEGRKTKQAERERKRLELEDMSAEELKRAFERQEEDLRAEYERELNQYKEENRKNSYVQTVYRVAPEIDGLPPFILKVMAEARNADDEDKVRELMEFATKEVSTLINKNRLVMDNRAKTSFRPNTGGADGATGRIPTKKEWERMNEGERREWTKHATMEQLEKAAVL